MCYKNLVHISANTSNWSDVFNKLESLYINEDLVLMPTEEELLLAYYNYIKNYAKSRILCEIPDERIFNLVRDKVKLAQFCKSKIIPIPEVYGSLGNAKFPFICKPKIGSGSKGIYIVQTDSDLQKLPNNLDNYLIQEYVDNSKGVIGAFAFVKDGLIISSYLHRRLVTYPNSGGVSVKSMTVTDEKLVQYYLEPLLLELRYSGLVMVEYLYDEISGDFKLIEINPRLWGSVLLSEICESKVIHNYINSCMNAYTVETKGRKEFYLWWIFPYGTMLFFKDFISGTLLGKKFVVINWSYSSIFRSINFHLLVYLYYKKLRHLVIWKK
jgi:predicted ATP-grasp superfamily ATP-dependent carboligase